MPTYTYSNLVSDVRRDASNITNIRRILNRAALRVIADLDLRSTKRKSYLSPVLNEDLNDYQAPSDLKAHALIDVRRLEGRQVDDKFTLVTTEYFDRRKSLNENIVCIEDNGPIKKLRISSGLQDSEGVQAVIHECDTLTGNGTWSVSLDASNLTLDEDMFLHGEASLNLDMDQAGTSTTVGIITNSDMDAVDLTGYEDGSVFVYAYFPMVTGLDGCTLRVGSSASNYYSKQVTTTNEGAAFSIGWNLLRFDLQSATETGTVDISAINYIRFTLDKGNDSLQSKDWRIDYIVARRGAAHEVWYYSKMPWQTAAGSYIENSTADTDLLNADAEEYELFVLKGQELLARDARKFDEVASAMKLYDIERNKYLSQYMSERMLLMQQNGSFMSSPSDSWLDDANK